MEKIKEYRIGVCHTLDLGDGMDLSEPYYKVYEVYDSGSVWFDLDFDDLEVAKKYVKISMERPELDKWARIKMAEGGKDEGSSR